VPRNASTTARACCPHPIVRFSVAGETATAVGVVVVKASGHLAWYAVCVCGARWTAEPAYTTAKDTLQSGTIALQSGMLHGIRVTTQSPFAALFCTAWVVCAWACIPLHSLRCITGPVAILHTGNTKKVAGTATVIVLEAHVVTCMLVVAPAVPAIAETNVVAR